MACIVSYVEGRVHNKPKQHVIVEKPVGCCAEDVQEMLQVCSYFWGVVGLFLALLVV